eukprot:878411-Prorocentrum_minimum.AAC.2
MRNTRTPEVTFTRPARTSAATSRAGCSRGVHGALTGCSRGVCSPRQNERRHVQSGVFTGR